MEVCSHVPESKRDTLPTSSCLIETACPESLVLRNRLNDVEEVKTMILQTEMLPHKNKPQWKSSQDGPCSNLLYEEWLAVMQINQTQLIPFLHNHVLLLVLQNYSVTTLPNIKSLCLPPKQFTISRTINNFSYDMLRAVATEFSIKLFLLAVK